MVMVNVLDEKILIFVSQDAKQQKLFQMIIDKGCTNLFPIDLNPRGLKAKDSPVY